MVVQGERGLGAGANVLITGGAGFIGANLVRRLLEHDYRVTVLDNLSAARRSYLEDLPVALIEGDIRDVDVVNRTVRSHEGVVHLAAHTGVPGSLKDPRRDCEVNVIGTLNLLEACRNATSPGSPVPRFVFASSNAPLGRQPPPATEDKAPLPISPYGASKLAGEAYCLAHHGSWGLPTVVLRFSNVYGPYSTHKTSVVSRFLTDIMEGGRITIEGDGEQTRDFIYVDDLCRAILAALQSDLGGEVFQIATGQETSIRELAALIQDVVGRDVGITHGPPRQGDMRQNFSSVRKAEAMLGWRPGTSLRDGLRTTWNWFSRQREAAATEGQEGVA